MSNAAVSPESGRPEIDLSLQAKARRQLEKREKRAKKPADAYYVSTANDLAPTCAHTLRRVWS